MNDMKAERFRRVAAPRVQKVLDSLDSLANCSNRNNYEYSSDDVSKMIRAIRAKVKSLEQRFGDDNGVTRSNTFTF